MHLIFLLYSSLRWSICYYYTCWDFYAMVWCVIINYCIQNALFSLNRLRIPTSDFIGSADIHMYRRDYEGTRTQARKRSKYRCHTMTDDEVVINCENSHALQQYVFGSIHSLSFMVRLPSFDQEMSTSFKWWQNLKWSTLKLHNDDELKYNLVFQTLDAPTAQQLTDVPRAPPFVKKST